MGSQATERAANGRSETSKVGVLFDVKRFALHDGPGIRTTAFLKGCPLSCSWCHNPESRSPKPELMFWAERCVGCGSCTSACSAAAVSMRDGIAWTDRSLCTGCGDCVAPCPVDARAIAGEAWSVERLLSEFEKDLLFFNQSAGGVTLSGGEPLAQVPFVYSVLAACQAHRIHTTVDTCGYANWESLERVSQVTDLFLYDVKHATADRHRELTGVSNERILDNLRRLNDEGRALWIRYPIIPGLNDAHEDVKALGGIVADLTSVEALHLLPFHRGGERKLERLGRPRSTPVTAGDPRDSAETAAGILRGILTVPVHVGG